MISLRKTDNINSSDPNQNFQALCTIFREKLNTSYTDHFRKEKFHYQTKNIVHATVKQLVLNI